MEIKVKKLNKNIKLPEIIKKGDWIDLRAACNIEYSAPVVTSGKATLKKVTFETMLIPLGVAMEIPKGFEAILVPRSSTFKKWGIIQTNSIGVIDHTFSSNSDEWKLPVVALTDGKITTNDRICQFRIQLSQKATMWQKLKWLFSRRIKIVEVDNLTNLARGGFGEGTKDMK